MAASTIDRRLSTVCGYYRFAHIDGRIPANPAQYVRRPKVQPVDQHAMDRGELGRFLFTAEHYDRAHAALAVLLGLNGLRVSEACATNVENVGFERGHRTLRILGKGNKPAVSPLVPRTARTIDLAVGERHEGPILLRRDAERLDRRTAHTAGCDRSASAPAWATYIPACSVQRSSWPPSHHHGLRPTPTELRPPRRRRRRRLRRRRLTTASRHLDEGRRAETNGSGAVWVLSPCRWCRGRRGVRQEVVATGRWGVRPTPRTLATMRAGRSQTSWSSVAASRRVRLPRAPGVRTQ